MKANVKDSVEVVLKTFVGEAAKEFVKSALSECLSAALTSVAASTASTGAAQLTVVLLRTLIGASASSDRTLRALFSEPLQTGIAEALSCFELAVSTPQDRQERQRRLDAADDRLAVALTLSRTGAQVLNGEILINLLRGLIAVERGSLAFSVYHLMRAENGLRVLEVALESEWQALRERIRNQPQLAAGGVRLQREEQELNMKCRQAAAFRQLCEELRTGTHSG